MLHVRASVIHGIVENMPLNNYERKRFTSIYHQAIALEYILDSENIKRKRKDMPVKRAWGYSMNIKGQLIEILHFWQPTLHTVTHKQKPNASHRKHSDAYFGGYDK